MQLIHKKIFIVDEISMVSLEDLVKLDKRCDYVWDSVKENSTIFGGLTVVIFLGGFYQIPQHSVMLCIKVRDPLF